jgi:DNA replication protein DnaC
MTAQPLTTSPPTSEQPLSPNLETIDALCPQHGAFVSRVLTMAGNKPIMSRCPTCAAERQANEQAQREREEQLLRRRQVDALLSASGIPARFSDRNFAGYIAAESGQKIALGVCRAYAQAWPEKRANGGSLVLTGGPGTGKTHLASAIGNTVMQDHLASVVFGTVATMLRHIKDSYRKDSGRSEQDAIDDLLRPDLLILDEVGVQVGSEHEKLLMFEVLNSRYQELRPTILISNLTATELEAFLGQRVMDRYRECGSVLAFDWHSHRGRQ